MALTHPSPATTSATSATPPVRWGILGAAEIARKNWHSILNSGNGTLAAVASRDLSRARQFIADGQAQFPFPSAPEAVGGYDALLARPDIDAVYVPLPTGLRKEWVLRAAAAGKHVLCEKPCAPTLADLQDMTAACARHQVQFLDGVMFMHSARLETLRSLLDEGSSVGELQRVQSAFSFRAPPEFFQGNIRAHSTLEPLGCLGDLGWYNLRLSLWAFREQLPVAVSGRLLRHAGRSDSPAPVPTAFSGELFFASGASAGFYCSFVDELQQWAQISGSRGSVRLDDFVLPHHGPETAFHLSQPYFEVTQCQFNMEPRSRRIAVAEYSNNHPSAQETRLFRHFAAQVRSGRLNPEWPQLALRTQQVLEACLASSAQDGRPVSLAR